MEPGEALRQHLARLRLVGGRPVRVDERDDEGLSALPLDEARRLTEELLAVERGVDGAVAQDALGHLTHAVARDEGERARRREVHRAGEPEPLDLEQVTEARGDQEPQRGAVALDDGVDGDRRAMDQVVDGLEVEAPLGHEGAEAVEHAAAGIVGHGRGLETRELARHLVQETEVGERAADVDAEAVASHAVSRLSGHCGHSDAPLAVR